MLHFWRCLCALLEILPDVQPNLCHQRLDGDEGASQRLGPQDAFQLFHLFGALANSRVLRWMRWVLQLSRHVGWLGCAAADFRAQRVLPHRLVTTFLAVRMQGLHDRLFIHRA